MGLYAAKFLTVTRRRILLLITDLQIGGTPTVVRELAIRLQPFAHVEVACLKKWGPVADQLRHAGVTVAAFDAAHAWHLPRIIRSARKLVRDHRIDTVLSFLVHANAVAAAALRLCPGVRGIQSIQTVQPRPAWHWWLQRRVQAKAEKMVVPSTAVATIARGRCNVDADRCIVIPNAIDPSAFERTRVFERTPIRVGFIGRLDPVKRIDRLIEAMVELRARPWEQPVECHIYGDGSMNAALRALVARHRLEAVVTLHGTIARPQDALKNIDALVLPSAGEGFGLVLIEAMAAGVPVIACDAGGVRDVIIDGQNGLLFRDDRARPSIADLVAQLSDDSELRARLIETGLGSVREKFTWDVVLPQYKALLNV